MLNCELVGEKVLYFEHVKQLALASESGYLELKTFSKYLLGLMLSSADIKINNRFSKLEVQFFCSITLLGA